MVETLRLPSISNVTDLKPKVALPHNTLNIIQLLGELSSIEFSVYVTVNA